MTPRRRIERMHEPLRVSKSRMKKINMDVAKPIENAQNTHRVAICTGRAHTKTATAMTISPTMMYADLCASVLFPNVTRAWIPSPWPSVVNMNGM